MPHEFQWSKAKARKIELLLPRLKYSVYPTNIAQWLENFEKDEVEHMIDLLRVFEYIPFNEFMFRLDSLLNLIFKKFPNVEDRILIYPYGKVGKSGTLVTYPLRNTRAFKKRESDAKKMSTLSKKEDYNIITHDYEKITISEDVKCVIFLDDFVGSGNTFIEEYGKPDVQKWLKEMKISKVFLLASIVMESAVEKIRSRFSNVEIVAERRKKILPTIKAAKFLFSNANNVEDIVRKYGNSIPVKPPPNQYTPLGYGESESLVSFFHGTPNNTLPIFWGDSKWKPLFPRRSETKMDRAKIIKRDIKYYLSLFDKIGYDLLEGERIVGSFPDGRTDRFKEKNQQNHAVITLIYLISLGLDAIIICQILGLTREELDTVYKECRVKKLISKGGELTFKARSILQQLQMKKRKDSIRNETTYNLEIKKILYLPRSINGNT
ncbi:phosphoribosyltransferase-like protein [Sphingobacterium sp. LRF_L2]|uniref:phosphoribosyltransferase-like protein n=1 Tax=Sphingobacterium sp. LRF_L2 TaxID=3369421 RepID=UPI003F5E3812